MSSETNQEINEQELNYPTVDITDLLKIIPNRFLLCSAISKRSRQLSEGEKPLIDVVREKPFNPVSIAMKELLLGKFEVSIKENVDDEIEFIEKLDKTLDEKIQQQENSEDSVSKSKDKKNKTKSVS